jgi:hypothetical protein
MSWQINEDTLVKSTHQVFYERNKRLVHLGQLAAG